MQTNQSRWEQWQLCSNYLLKLSQRKGQSLSRMDTTHIMFLYFEVHGLDVLGRLDLLDKEQIRDYVLSLQLPCGGFAPSCLYTSYSNNNKSNVPHIVFTYSALNILAIVGGIHSIDLSKCLASIRRCQKENGSFSNFENSEEADLRFVYAAIACCSTINDFSGINREKTIEYIHNCFNFDGGYGLRPNSESHCGAIYCALASLKLLDSKCKHPERTLNFLVNRQVTNNCSQLIIGVQGRVGKAPDTCYTFWVGSALAILLDKPLLHPKVESFLQVCFHENAQSFGKNEDSQGDPLHTLHSLVGLKIMRQDAKDICLQRGICKHHIRKESVESP